MTARGVLTVHDLRARCKVDPMTGCWAWLGAKDGTSPRIWTLDYARVEKGSLSGPRAVWNIAHQSPIPAGALVFRRCQTPSCCNPVHMGLAWSKAEIGQHVARVGKRKGTCLEQRRANIAKAIEASGVVVTPRAIVIAIKQSTGSAKEVAAEHNVSTSLVWAIRRGQRHEGVEA